MPTSRVLFVMTSHNKIDKINKPSGWYLPEAAHPYYTLKEAGYTIDWASPKGGEAPLDQSSVEAFKDDAESKKFLAEVDDWKHTETLSKVVADPDFVSKYDAVFYPGGHGPVYDLPFDADSQKILASFFDAGKPTAAVCHGPAVLQNVTLKDGSSLVKGRKVTGFCNVEEEQAGLTDAMPYLLEDRLKEVGGEFSKAKDAWGAHVVVDGVLITGQNPASAKGVGEAINKALKA